MRRKVLSFELAMFGKDFCLLLKDCLQFVSAHNHSIALLSLPKNLNIKLSFYLQDC